MNSQAQNPRYRRIGLRGLLLSNQTFFLWMFCCFMMTTFIIWSWIDVPSKYTTLKDTTQSKGFDVQTTDLKRLNIVDRPENSFTELELDTPIITNTGKILDQKSQSKWVNPPTLRQVREQFKVSSVLPLSKPWGTVFSPNRITCLVPTVWPKQIKLLKSLAATWGALCDHLYFVISADNNPPATIEGVETIIVKMKRSGSGDVGQRNIWEKMWRLWYLLGTSEKLLAEAEWFAKIDDDSFLSVTNFKGFSRYLDPEEAYYIGHTVPWRWSKHNIVFNSGTCYALSRAVIKRVVPIFHDFPKFQAPRAPLQCVDREGAGEDPAMSVCLRSIGINPLNTLDENLRNRFLIFRDTDHELMWRDTSREEATWYWKYRPKYMGLGCCSEYLISAHNFKLRGNDYHKEFLRLNRTYNSAKNWDDIPLPPRPRWFLYNDVSVDFKFDEFRNALPPRGQRVHLSEKFDFYCWECVRGDLFWLEEHDAKFEGITPPRSAFLPMLPGNISVE